MKVFRLYDLKAAAWLPFFVSHNTATAIRGVEEAIMRNEAPHAEDLALYEIGVDDADDSGLVMSYDQPRHIVYVRDLVREHADADKRTNTMLASVDYDATPAAEA